MSHTVTPVLGINFDKRSLTNDEGIALGTKVNANDGHAYVFVQASGTVATGTCTVDLNTFLVTDTAGNFNATVAFADAEYGWVQELVGIA